MEPANNFDRHQDTRSKFGHAGCPSYSIVYDEDTVCSLINNYWRHSSVRRTESGNLPVKFHRIGTAPPR